MSQKSLNEVRIIGNVVKKPEVFTTRGNTKVSTFHVITHRDWYVDGEKKKDSTKIICVAWDKVANLCSNLLEKGSYVHIKGRLQEHSFVDTNGVHKEQYEVVVDEFIKLD